MDEARHAVATAAALLRSAAAALRCRDADDVQIELRDLALSWAELYVAEVLLEATPTGAGLPGALARIFCAEAVGNLHARLRVRHGAFGLTPDAVDDAPSLAFMDAALAPGAVAAAGEQVRASGIVDVALDAEHELMRSTFRRFAEDKVMPLAADVHRRDAMIPDAIIDGLRELGCFGICVPTRYGGLNPDHGDDSLGMVVVTEELSRGSLGAAGSLITRPEIMARALLAGGTEAQKARWLPGIAAGDPLVAISVTEPDTGSDVAAVALRAASKRLGGQPGWALSGAKTWCTFAGKAGVILVLARTDPTVAPPHRGLSLFVVEKPSSGGRSFRHASPHGADGGSLVGRAIPTIGYRGMHSFELAFDEYFVPHSALVGEDGGQGRGFYYTMRGFAGGRLQTAARATGLMRAAAERGLAYAEQRTVFGRPVASYPLTLAKLAGMAAAIAACQHVSYAVAAAMDRGDGQLEASLAKLFACRAAERVTRESMQLHGGMGYAEESDVSRYYVDARVLSIFEGTEETLALKVVGKALLADGVHLTELARPL